MPRNNQLVLEDVRIVFRNFAGRAGMYNAEGDRNFAVLLDNDTAVRLAEDGWNVKMLRPREEGEDPQPYLSVTVSYKNQPPTIKLIGSRQTTELTEDTVEMVDFVEISQCDLIISPYDWNVNGKTGRKAYLKSMYVTIIEDPLELKYGNMDFATVDGPMLERTDMMIPPKEA